MDGKICQKRNIKIDKSQKLDYILSRNPQKRTKAIQNVWKRRIMKYHYCLKNFEHGYDHGCRYMMLALYKDGELESIERVYEPEPDGPFEFCQDIRYGQHCAFDVLADYMGEDAAAYRLEEYCFEPCWEHPGKLHIIDGESFADASKMVDTWYNENPLPKEALGKMDLRIPVVIESRLWDDEGIIRFRKCFGTGA